MKLNNFEYCATTWFLGFLLACCLMSCSNSLESATTASEANQSGEQTGPFCGGTGSESDPYLICTVRQLKSIDGDRRLGDGSYDKSMRGKSFRIVNDLDLRSVSAMRESFIQYFSGHLDGGGHTLKNLGLNGEVLHPLFAFNTGVIENLTLDHFSVVGPAALLGSNYYLTKTVNGLQTDEVETIGTVRDVKVSNGSLYSIGNFVISAGIVVGLNNASVSNITVEQVSISVTGVNHSGGGVGCIIGYSGISGYSTAFIHAHDLSVNHCEIIDLSPQAGWAKGSVVGFNADAPVTVTSITEVGSLPLVGREL
jgi:hypothetical protein